MSKHHMHQASAPAKLILCGEHAVVYARPAIAVPLHDLRAVATLSPTPVGSGVRISAPDLGADWTLHDEPDHPLSQVIRVALTEFALPDLDATITLQSAIPIASGMGSGASIGTALVRVVAAVAGATPSAAEVAALVYASEQGFHGTPSGIDNTVVAYEQAISFQRRAQDAPLITALPIAQPLVVVVGDTGVRSPTRLPVGMVRAAWQAAPARYDALFDAVAHEVARAQAALATGDLRALGAALDANHALLEQIGVSSPELECLVTAARAAGALGAKLSGGGWGGVMLALATPERAATIARALQDAGAERVFVTTVAAM